MGFILKIDLPSKEIYSLAIFIAHFCLKLLSLTFCAFILLFLFLNKCWDQMMGVVEIY